VILQWLAPILGVRQRTAGAATNVAAPDRRRSSASPVVVRDRPGSDALEDALEDPRPASSTTRCLADEDEPSRALTFDEIYAEHFDFVWRNLVRLGVARIDVDDAAHDVFLVVHRRLPDFDGQGSVKGWLFAIARRVAWHYRRAHARRRTVPLADTDPVDGASIEREQLQTRREAHQLVHRILDELDDERRAVFVLVELEQLSVPVAAEMLRVPLNTTYSRLRLARRDFERKLRLVESGLRRRS
jgi:RNA polymerase sigma-70 factor (ECF subfamily)